MLCNRCTIEIADNEHEYCWYCQEHLCAQCWKEYGHCGHEEAEKVNEYARGEITYDKVRAFLAQPPLKRTRSRASEQGQDDSG